MMDGFGGTSMMGLGLLFWLAIIAGVVALVVWVVRSSSQRGTGSSSHGPDALEIARRRYASGEISKEQFEQLKNDLGR
jgi:putative membrane protein